MDDATELLTGYVTRLERLGVGGHDAEGLVERWNVRDLLPVAAPAGIDMIAAGMPVQVLMDLPAVYCKHVSAYAVRAREGHLDGWTVADIARLVETALGVAASPEAACFHLAGQSDPDVAVELLEAVGRVASGSGWAAMPAAYLKAGCSIEDIAWLYSLNRMTFAPSSQAIALVGTLPFGDRARLGLLLASKQTSAEVIAETDRRAGGGHAEVARLILDGWTVEAALESGRALANLSRTRVTRTARPDTSVADRLR